MLNKTVDFRHRLWYMFGLPKEELHMDYMTALLERFGIPTPRKSELLSEIKTVEEELTATLDERQKEQMTHLMDVQNTLRQESAVYAFLSGFRLACGIRSELDSLPSFPAICEAEKRELTRLEEGIKA